MNNSSDHVIKSVTYRGQKISVTIDRIDEELFDKYTWHGSSNGGKSGIFYITTSIHDSATGKTRRLYLHRYLMNPPAGMVVDHINRDTTDNRRSNLRIVTRSQNIANSRGRTTYRGHPTSSVFKGVSWRKKNGKWIAQIYHSGKSSRLGYYKDESEAARAYDARARELHGVYASLTSGHTPKAPEPKLSQRTS